jgi:hypothetical protein
VGIKCSSSSSSRVGGVGGMVGAMAEALGVPGGVGVQQAGGVLQVAGVVHHLAGAAMARAGAGVGDRQASTEVVRFVFIYGLGGLVVQQARQVLQEVVHCLARARMP